MIGGTRGGPQSSPYRGEDRRRAATRIESPWGKPFWMAVLLIAIVWLLLTFAVSFPARGRVDLVLVGHLLQLTSAIVASAVGLISVARWRLSGDAPALWVGSAVLLYGILRLGVAELLPLVAPGGVPALAEAWLRPAALAVVVLLLVRAVTIPAVDARYNATRLAAVTLVALAVAVAAVQLVPGLATLIDGAAAQVPRNYLRANVLGVLPPLWLVLGVAFVVKGRRQGRWLFPWIALLLFTLALAEVARVVAPPPLVAGLLGREVLRLLGLLAALYGATREIVYTYSDAQARLARSQFSEQTAQQRMRAEQADAEERAHEARSALAAIEGATRTLEHYRDRLPPETQRALSAAVSSEIRRLQRLVSATTRRDAPEVFDLADAIQPLAVTEQARGADITVHVPADVRVAGSAGATAEVLQTLLDNARRYAPDSPVVIRAEEDHEWVIVRIEDRGPGVSPEQRESIFRRGVRGDAATDIPGSGLGLYVASRRVEEQGGDLWVDGRDGGGASFAVALPKASAGDGAVTIEDVENAVDVVQRDALSASRRRH